MASRCFFVRFGCAALLLAAAAGCSWRSGDARYDFSDPMVVHDLPDELRELSGLFVLQGKYAVGVSDEHDRFFVIDLVNGRVVREQRFDLPSDYEDVVRIGSRLVILDGEGVLLDLPDMRVREPAVSRYPIPSVLNAEALAYDGAQNRLLIGGITDTTGGGGRGAVYDFHLRRKEIDPRPLFTISMEEVRRALGPDNGAEGLDEPIFKPSGMAIQPGTRDLYVISSKVKVLLVYDPEGTLRAAHPLPPDLFTEPEGIAFLSWGDLLIVNEEHQDRPASLLRFKHERGF